MKKRAIVVAVAAILLLTGCEKSWEDIADDKERCEALGGEFDQWTSGWGVEQTECYFDDREADE